jgi:hypothetical protein
MRRHQERSKLMKTAADRFMYIQPIQPGAPSIARGKSIPVAASLLIRAAAVLLAGASVLAVLKLFLSR